MNFDRAYDDAYDPRVKSLPFVVCGLIFGSAALAQSGPVASAGMSAAAAVDPVGMLVGRLDLEKYKATIKGLTQFGDRRQGTDRNRAAIDWIEAQLKSYGCTNTERINVRLLAAAAARPPAGAARGGTPDCRRRAAAGSRGVRARTGVNTDPHEAARREAARAQHAADDADGPREEVFCTKVGTTHPDEMYIVGGHMDGHRLGRGGERRRLRHGARDGAGARSSARPTCRPSARSASCSGTTRRPDSTARAPTSRSAQALQGKEDPPGSGQYPEPKWLGMIQHDMMLFDHGMPRPDGTMRKEQRPEADVNIEFQSARRCADGAQKLAWVFQAANEKYATDYPAAVGPHMTNTDSARRSWISCPRSACARTSAARRSAPAGIRTGTSRPTSSRPTPTRISASA